MCIFTYLFLNDLYYVFVALHREIKVAQVLLTIVIL